MEFLLAMIGIIGVIVGLLVLVGHQHPGSGADILDWKPTRSYETELRLEMDDVKQMIEAQNEYRSRRGAPPLTERDAKRAAAEDEHVRQKAARDFLEDELGA